MPGLHTDRIFELLEARLPAGDRLSMNDVLAGVLPSSVQAWLTAAIADRLAADLQTAPHLSRTAGTPGARRIGRGVVAALVPQYVIDRGDLLLLLRDAVEFVEAFLHRPRRTLEELLLGNAESLPVALLPSRLAIITEYTYLGVVLSRLLSERTAASRDELKSLIARVDGEVISRHAPEELAQLMTPLFHWYELAGMQGIPVEAVLDFLDDKEMGALRDYVGNIARIRAQSTLCAAEIGSLAADMARGAALPPPEATPGASSPAELVTFTPEVIQQLSVPVIEEVSSGLNGAGPPGVFEEGSAIVGEVSGTREPGSTPPPRGLESPAPATEQAEVSGTPDSTLTPGVPEGTGEASEQADVFGTPEPGSTPPPGALESPAPATEQAEVSGTPEPGGAPPPDIPEGTEQASEQVSGVPESGSTAPPGELEVPALAAERAEVSGTPEPGGAPSPAFPEGTEQEPAMGGGIPETFEPASPAVLPDANREKPSQTPEPGSSTAPESPHPERKQPALRLPPEPERRTGEPSLTQTPVQERARQQEGTKGAIRRNFALALTSAGLKLGAPAAKPKPPLASEFSEEQRKLLIASLFRNEAGYFDNVVQTLAGFHSWRDGARYLTDFLEINRLNPYAKDVLQFTGIVRRWFVGEEEGQ